jgi:hypothetical protein
MSFNEVTMSRSVCQPWRSPGRRAVLSVLTAWAILAAPGPGRARADAPRYRCTPDGPAFVFTRADGATDVAIEASAVESIGDGRYVLVAHDKAAPLRVVDARMGRVHGEPLTCDAFPSGLKVGPKWEGLARDEQGAFYVIGSHSGNSAEERAERAYLYRFRVAGEGTTADPLRIAPESVARWHVADALVRVLRAEGLGDAAIDQRKIEGLAVRVRRDAAGAVTRRELVIGLRNPDDRVRVYAADITELPAHEADLALAPLFAFDAGALGATRFQLTSLEHATLLGRDGFLVLTATEGAKNAFHGNRLWFVPDDNHGSPECLWEFEPAMKAEGIAALPGGDGQSARFVVTYDNDPLATHIPSRLQFVTITAGAGD